MSAQRKQYADLIRHRELNALRRLMVGRHTPLPTLRPSQQLPVNPAELATGKTIERIDELEMQMNQLLFDRSTGAQPLTRHADSAFGVTRILPFQTTQFAPIPAPHAAEQAVISQAATLFATGQDAQAQLLLASAISAQGEQRDHVPTWLALLDLYRATDQPALFDAAALDFSVRFGRSTPAWISIPALAEKRQPPFAAALQLSASELSAADWIAPPYLTDGSLQGFESSLAQAVVHQRSFVMDWRGLVSVDPTQWRALQALWSQLASQPVRGVLLGQSALMQALSSESSDAMLAHLTLLRCLHQASAYEDLALAFCVSFEISPPDWTGPLCRLEARGSLLVQPQSQPNTAMASPELHGNLDDLPYAFQAARASSPTLSADWYIIRCDRLVRCSPKATLALRLWLKEAAGRGQRTELTDVHRVVAAYWLSQGIYEHARVTIRKD